MSLYVAWFVAQDAETPNHFASGIISEPGEGMVLNDDWIEAFPDEIRIEAFSELKAAEEWLANHKGMYEPM